ncbi:MAG TPA: sigma factor [Pyrinomonadaceae bacterium]|nr:sigma factor [Pyrinomonadaceae bacterium]
MPQASETLEQVFREEYGRIIATLIRQSGSFDLAEEALQEAFVSAASTWPSGAVPHNPGAWLTTVAHRKLLDAVRRDKTRTDKQSEIESEASGLKPFVEPMLEEPVEYPDDRLRLINYQIQAAIAAVHCEAQSAAETDWRQIVALYEELMRITDSPVVALNHAAAVAMSEGVEKGLSLIEAAGAGGALDNYYLYHASRADLFRRLRRFDEATAAYRRALELTTNSVERNYIEGRLRYLATGSHG